MYKESFHIQNLPSKNLSKGEVHIWFGKMPDPFPLGDLLDDLLDVLSPREHDRYQAYKVPNKQKEFLYGRFFMKSILASYLKVPACEITFSINQYKRPYLSQNEFQFNLSHSFGAFALIISKNHSVGIDIEYTQRKISIDDGRHVFMQEEIQSMKAKIPTAAKNEFLERWTLKEAIYKAADQGPKLLFNEFSVDVEELTLSSETPLLAPIHRDLGSFSPLEDYLIAYAVKNPNKDRLHVQSFQITG